MSLPGINPGPPGWETSTLVKSHLNCIVIAMSTIAQSIWWPCPFNFLTRRRCGEHDGRAVWAAGVWPGSHAPGREPGAQDPEPGGRGLCQCRAGRFQVCFCTNSSKVEWWIDSYLSKVEWWIDSYLQRLNDGLIATTRDVEVKMIDW
jgi:hypothetical protein